MTSNSRIDIRIDITGATDEGHIATLYGIIDTLQYRKEDGYFEKVLNEGQRDIFIASYDGRPAAFTILNRQPRYSLFKRLGIPEIQDLNVIHDLRQNGIAGALIDHCEALAKERGHSHIGIGVGLHKDYGPAQRLYVKKGYMPDGFGIVYDREPLSYGDHIRVDDDLNLMMIKEL